MYLPSPFVESRAEVLQDLIRAHPLAAVVTRSALGLEADHLPLRWAQVPDGSGVLRGHVARANPMAQAQAGGDEVLAIFTGPQAYVSPSWYPSKQEDGRVVPTWNYLVVHAHGTLRLVDDGVWLRRVLQDLTDAQEAGFPHPWGVDDAPGDYLEKLLEAVVGIELTVTRLVGKWKASQNRTPADRAGVVEGLRVRGDGPSGDLGARMAGLDGA